MLFRSKVAVVCVILTVASCVLSSNTPGVEGQFISVNRYKSWQSELAKQKLIKEVLNWHILDVSPKQPSQTLKEMIVDARQKNTDFNAKLNRLQKSLYPRELNEGCEPGATRDAPCWRASNSAANFAESPSVNNKHHNLNQRHNTGGLHSKKISRNFINSYASQNEFNKMVNGLDELIERLSGRRDSSERVMPI